MDRGHTAVSFAVDLTPERRASTAPHASPGAVRPGPGRHAGMDGIGEASTNLKIVPSSGGSRLAVGGLIHDSPGKSGRSDRLRDTTDRVPSYIPQWARGEIDAQQRRLELVSGGRKASRTQPYMPIGCPVLEMPHPIDLLHGRQIDGHVGSTTTRPQHDANGGGTSVTRGSGDQVPTSTVASSGGGPSPLTLLSERPQPRRDSFGPWQTLKRRTRESATNVRACKYGANFLDQMSGKAHRLTQRASKSLQQQIQTHHQQRQKQHQNQEHHPAQGEAAGHHNGDGTATGFYRPHTAPADLDVTGHHGNSFPASFDTSRQLNTSRPRVLTSYTKNTSSLKDHLLPYEHAMTFEALFTQSESALKSINGRLEAKLIKMDETRYKNYQRKYSAVTEIGSVSQNSHINFRKHLRAVRCKMALDATREALEMLSSHPWYAELNHKLEETHRLCGHVSLGESFLVEEVGKVLSEGKHFTKENFRNSLMRLPLEAHQLLEVQDIIYFIGNKVGMTREEYRHWISVFGRAQADDIIRAYDRIRRQVNGRGGSEGEGGTQMADAGEEGGGTGKVTTKKISAAKFLQLRSIAFADENESEASVQEASLSDVNHGGHSWRFLKSYSSRSTSGSLRHTGDQLRDSTGASTGGPSGYSFLKGLSSMRTALDSGHASESM